MYGLAHVEPEAKEQAAYESECCIMVVEKIGGDTMKKATAYFLVLLMMFMAGCETSEQINSQVSEPSSIIEESSEPAEEVKSLLVLREGEFSRKPHTPDQEDVERDRRKRFPRLKPLILIVEGIGWSWRAAAMTVGW